MGMSNRSRLEATGVKDERFEFRITAHCGCLAGTGGSIFVESTGGCGMALGCERFRCAGLA